MAKILQLRSARPQKFGYKKARRRSRPDADEAQIDLFSVPSLARIVSLPHKLSPFEEALLFDERGNHSKALHGYLRAIEEGDCLADAFCNLGILESEQGRLDKAVECFKNSLKHDPALFESHFNLANVYFDLGDYRPAQVHYEIAASLDPNYANLYFNLALTLAMQDAFERAIEALESYRGLSSSPDAEKADSLLRSLRRSINQN